MSSAWGFLGKAFRNGTFRAAVVFAIFMIAWASKQLGGLNVFLINSWIVLSLPLVIASIGVTLVIFTRQFDLSAAGVVTFTNVLMVTWLSEINVWLAVIIAIVVGVAIGALNATFIVLGRLPAIAVTLATLIILNGLALVILPTPGGRVSNELIDAVTGPLAIPRGLVLIVLLALAWVVFRRTRLGIYLFAVGQDEEAVRLSGVSVAAVRFASFSIAGGLYALAGVVLTAAIQSGDASIGSSYLLQTFAAIAIGGTAFTGGSGSVIGTILGALTLTVIPKFLFVIGISGWVQQVFTGVLIIAAVLVGAISTRTENRRKRVAAPTQSPGGEPKDPALVGGEA
ncbi:MAG: ABC transporter permease [Microbacterium sp.]|uniref:ABC transporter permease n=1 Tax=Microbacterium sp. TaxID=51671 RepID=UPI001AD4B78E|nr:ABC transporter permease [Microbacterium sp.]MBN9155538.1 ABC transporter permease [Microbacterium sp.]